MAGRRRQAYVSSSYRKRIRTAARRASLARCGVFIACAFLTGLVGGCLDDSTRTGQEVPVPTHIVWILLDALRADHLSSYGYDRPTSPVLDALAARGVRATNAFSQASATLLSVPTFMTGRYEPAFYQDARHFDVWFLRRPPPEERLVSTIFRAHGYETAMFSASPWYSADSRLAQSFDSFAPLAHAEGRDPRDRASNTPLFEWIEGHAAQPFFLYVHSLSTHEPRFHSNTDPRWLVPDYPPDRDAALRRRWTNVEGPFDERDRAHVRGLYDGGILAADGFVGEIEAALREAGILDRTLIVVSSDHGEALAEDGVTIGHPSRESFDELIHVPMIFAGPGVPVGRRIESIVENVDIVPTLVDLAGLETEAEFQGRSLRTAMVDSNVTPHTYAYARTSRSLAFTEPDRVLVHPDRKFTVRERRVRGEPQLKIETWGRPDSVAARTPLDPANDVLDSVRREITRTFVPLRKRLREQPLEVPPVFEFAHHTRPQTEKVLRDQLDPGDGRWSDVDLGKIQGGGRKLSPFVQDRVLIGSPRTESLPTLELSRKVPNGRYRVSLSLHFLEAFQEPVAFRFRAEGDTEWRTVSADAGKGHGPLPDWQPLGTFAVEDGRFHYAIAAAEGERAAVIGRLRFEVVGAEASDGPTEAERQAEIERLRALGYVE